MRILNDDELVRVTRSRWTASRALSVSKSESPKMRASHLEAGIWNLGPKVGETGVGVGWLEESLML